MSKRKKSEIKIKEDDLSRPTSITTLEEPREWNFILELKEEIIGLVLKQSKEWVEFEDNIADGYRFFVLGSFTRLLISELIIDGHLELLSGDGVEWFESTLQRVAYAALFREGIPFKTKPIKGRLPILLREYARVQREYAVYCARRENELVRPLKIQRISVQNFAPYGRGREFSEKDVEDYYKEKNSNIFYLDGSRYSGMSLWEGSGQPVELGRFVAYKTEFEAVASTTHKDTDELIVPDRPCILQIEASESSIDHFNGDLFLIPEGVPIYIKKGLPHHIPFGLTMGAFTSPVLFQVNPDTRQREVAKRVYKYKRVFLRWPKF